MGTLKPRGLGIKKKLRPQKGTLGRGGKKKILRRGKTFFLGGGKTIFGRFLTRVGKNKVGEKKNSEKSLQKKIFFILGRVPRIGGTLVWDFFFQWGGGDPLFGGKKKKKFFGGSLFFGKTFFFAKAITPKKKN